MAGFQVTAEAWQTWRLPDVVGAAMTPTLGEAKQAVTEARETNRMTQALIKDLKDSWDELYFDVKANGESSAVLTRNTAELIGDLRAGLAGGIDSRGKWLTGVLPETSACWGTCAAGRRRSARSFHSLVESVDKTTLLPLEQVFRNVTSLTVTLDEQVKTQSQCVALTLSSLNVALKDLDRLIADPNLQKTLANVEKTTLHVGETAETLDIATLTLRKKANQVTAVLKMLLGMFKFPMPIP